MIHLFVQVRLATLVFEVLIQKIDLSQIIYDEILETLRTLVLTMYQFGQVLDESSHAKEFPWSAVL